MLLKGALENAKQFNEHGNVYVSQKVGGLSINSK